MNTLAIAGLMALCAAPIFSLGALVGRSSRRIGVAGILAFCVVFIVLAIVWLVTTPID